MENSKVKRFLAILACLWGSVAYADQTSIVIPETGAAWDAAHPTTPATPHTFENTAKFFINPTLKSITSNFSGNGCGGITSPVPWQWCVDTNARTVDLYTAPIAGTPFQWRPAFTIASDGTLGANLSTGAAAGNLGFTPLNPANNLSDVASAPTSRTNLGLGSIAVLNIVGSANLAAGVAAANLGFTPLNPANNLSDVGNVAIARGNLSAIPHVTNNTALLAFTSYTTPVVRDSYSSLGDKGSATFVHSGTACSSADNGNQVTAADGGCWLNQSLELRPEMYGGGNSASGSTNVAAFNAALATVKSVICDGTYTITDKIIILRNGALGGSNRQRESCVLAVDAATFNMSAAGVVQMCGPASSGSEPGGFLHDTTITFVQPDTAVKASLNAYPPAIMADTDAVYPSTGAHCSRFRMERVKITKAWTGIDMRGNSGGVNIVDLEMSAFNFGIRIDNALDILRFDRIHWWPFGGLSGTPMTSNQSTVFNSSSIAIETGRADGLYLTDCVFLGGVGISTIDSLRSSGGTWMAMNGGGFDTHSGVQTLSTTSGNASTFQFSNIYFSPVSSADFALNLSAPAVKAYITNSSFFTVFSLTNPPVRVSGSSAELQISNSDFQSQGIDMVNVSQTNGSLILMGNQFHRNNSGTFSTFLVNNNGGRLTAMGNRLEDAGSATGTAGTFGFIKVTTDNFHRVIGNVGVGWPSSFPTATNGVYTSN